MIPASVIATAETVLVDTCTITRPTGSSYTPGAAGFTSTADDVYAGACSISAPQAASWKGDGADDRLVGTRVLRLPNAIDQVQVGDLVVVDRDDVPPLTVQAILSHSSTVLRRVRCVATTDAPGVPT